MKNLVLVALFAAFALTACVVSEPAPPDVNAGRGKNSRPASRLMRNSRRETTTRSAVRFPERARRMADSMASGGLYSCFRGSRRRAIPSMRIRKPGNRLAWTFWGRFPSYDLC